MGLSDVLIPLKLLDTAGLNIKNKQLALTALSQLMKIKNMKSAIPFKFGDGRVVHTSKKVTIPAIIGQSIEVVPANTLLLLSKTFLKTPGGVRDIKNYKLTMFKQPVRLEPAASGHYCENLEMSVTHLEVATM